jgi:rod shape-determining protein MreD
VKPRVPLPPIALPLTRWRKRGQNAFEVPPTPFEQQLIPIISIILASLNPLLPIIATFPSVPPLGFMMLLAWRLMRQDLWPAWVAAPLGLFDDLMSGAPIGSAIALWTVTLIIIDFIDMRLIWRDYQQDWGIASAFVAVYILVSAALAGLTGGAIGLTMLVPQMVISVLFFPLMMRIVAVLDGWRSGR